MKWYKCKEKTPDKPNAAYRQLWTNPYDEKHSEWMYFNGGVDEYDQIVDIDSTVVIDQNTVEWLDEQCSESRIGELEKDVLDLQNEIEHDSAKAKKQIFELEKEVERLKGFITEASIFHPDDNPLKLINKARKIINNL